MRGREIERKKRVSERESPTETVRERERVSERGGERERHTLIERETER